MTDILTPSARPVVRAGDPGLVRLTSLEMRKSLSTRSGRSLAVAAVLLAPVALTVASLQGDEFNTVSGLFAGLGVATALVLMSLGVLSTAGEWTHRTVQTTFLLVPRRGRVLAAKTTAVAVLGAGLTAVSAAAAAGVLTILAEGDVNWDGVPRAMLVTVLAGAAFAVVGAGVGAAVANSAAALTALYLTVLGLMPVLRITRPELSMALDPVDAVLTLSLNYGASSPALVLVGWVVVSTTAGALLTRRRQVA